MQNALKGVILKVTTKNSNVNAATLQAMQYMTVLTAVDRPSAVQNGQNNDTTTLHSIPCNCSYLKFKLFMSVQLCWCV